MLEQVLEELKAVGTVILGSGLAVAGVKRFFDYQERKEVKNYLAIQLAFKFEGFAIDCAKGLEEHQLAVVTRGNCGVLLSRVPGPPELPTSEAYRFMDSDILNEVLGFTQRCSMAQLAANEVMEIVGDVENYRESVRVGTVSMGSEALEIARNIRSEYELKPRALTFGRWKIDEFMKTEMQAVEERRKKVEAQFPEGRG